MAALGADNLSNGQQHRSSINANTQHWSEYKQYHQFKISLFLTQYNAKCLQCVKKMTNSFHSHDASYCGY